MNRRRPPRFPCSSAPYVPILIPHRPNTVKSTRNMLWLLAMLFCNWPFIRTGTSSTVSTRPDVVNIGALLSYNSSIGKVAKVALETAVEDVNSNPAVLNGTKLNLTMQDTKLSSGFLGIVEASRFMENETVAIIGPQHSVMAHVISHIANELQVPLLSFAATDPTLNSLQFPYFVRTTQSDGFQMAAVADIVGYYEWRDVIAIYIDDDHGRNGVSALGDKLAEKRCKISYKAPMSPKLSSVEITRTLVKVNSMDSRVFILHISATWGLEVLINAAREMNMMRREYVWIATDWLSTVLDTESSLTSAAMDSIQGVLTLRMHIPDSEPKKKLFSRWNNILTASNYTENSRFGLNTYGIYAYDTVWLLAHSLDEFLNQGGNISFSNDTSLTEFQGGRLQFDAMSIFDGGNKLRDIISRVNTTGVTGKLEFTSEGDLVHPAYEVINVIGTGIRTIGYWSNSSGLSVNFSDPDKHNANSKQQLYGVIWPGQTTQKPRGWAFSNNNGRQLRVGVPNRINYPEFVSQIENSDNSYGGFCIDVFNAAKEELPYAVQYKFVPYGDGHKNPVTSDLLHMITTGALDAVVGDITITTNRTKMVDFTQPFIESGLVVVAPVWKLNSSAWAFLRPFTPMMWCATGVYFLLVGAVLWILERRTNDEFRGPPRRQFVTIIWFSFSTLFFSHKERIASTLGRFVLIIWLFVVLILNSSYTASMTSILTVERLSSPVKGIESLVTSSEPIGFQRGSFSENYLTDELNIHKSRLVPLNSIAEYEKALRDGPSKGGVAAVVDERAYMELFLSTRCEFGIVGQEFTKMGWGFAFPRDSPLAIDMSTAILTLSENGVLQRLHDKWLTRSACSSEGTKQGVDRLQLQSFWGLFILCGSVCLLALLFYLIKMIREYTRHSRQISPQSGRLRSFLSFVKEKEDHHHEEAEGKSESKSSRPTRDQRVHSNGRVHGEIMMAS